MTHQEQGKLRLKNVEQFARYIGSTTNSVYTRLSRKEFPQDIYVKIGSRPMFIESKVEEWILSGAKLIK